MLDAGAKRMSANPLKFRNQAALASASSEPILGDSSRKQEEKYLLYIFYLLLNDVRSIKPGGANPINMLPPAIRKDGTDQAGCCRNPSSLKSLAGTKLEKGGNFAKEKKADESNTWTESALTLRIRGAAISGSNIFASEFSFVGGKGEVNPIRLKIYFPFSAEPKRPIAISIKRDATVEESIGYSLYQYAEERRMPILAELKMANKISAWNMRICEDDGTIDEDFPGTCHIFQIFQT
jgi:hypothetical protein